MTQGKSGRSTNKSINVVFITMTALMLSAIIFFCVCTTYTGDDYYYSGFLNDGIKGFIKGNIGHYAQRNGRVLIHLAAELMLSGGFPVYAAAITAVLLLSTYLLARFQGLSQRGKVTAYFTVFTLWVFSFSYMVLKNSFLSVADACNYILPILPISALAHYLNTDTPPPPPHTPAGF